MSGSNKNQEPQVPPVNPEDIWETEEAKRYLKDLEESRNDKPLPELESGFGFL